MMTKDNPMKQMQGFQNLPQFGARDYATCPGCGRSMEYSELMASMPPQGSVPANTLMSTPYCKVCKSRMQYDLANAAQSQFFQAVTEPQMPPRRVRFWQRLLR